MGEPRSGATAKLPHVRLRLDDPKGTAVRCCSMQGDGEAVTQSAKTIAVIGSGISGLSADWLLSRRHEVVLFERDGRPGGHGNTVDVVRASSKTPVDTGFIVYNTQCYPNLVALFDHLGVATAPSDMSFAVSLDDGAYDYSGTGHGGVFGQISNLLRPGHLDMLRDIRRFFRAAPALLTSDPEQQPLTTTENIFVTLNPVRPIATSAVLATFDYSHPLFDTAALGGVRRPWTVASESGRIHLGGTSAVSKLREAAE